MASFPDSHENPADVAPMLHEIATVGTAMAIAVTVIRGLMIFIAARSVRSTETAGKAPMTGGAE